MACPSVGEIGYQSAPLVSSLTYADRYVLVGRELAAQSLYRRDRVRRDLPGTVLEECVEVVEAGRVQAVSHVAGSDVFLLDYRDLVEGPEAAVGKLAEWLGCEPWPIQFEIYDGDEGLSECR